MNFHRYAVYFTPPDGPLADFGARWLGWDIGHGRAQPHPDIAGLPLPISDITEAPRRYGLHATLKPPFQLARGQDVQTLQTQLGALAAQISPIRLPRLKLVALGRFLALVPGEPVPELPKLANRLVRELDRFRRPSHERDLAARRKPHLTPSQDSNLMRWGYPYVMEDFRFHITLTGRLSTHDVATTQGVLAPLLADVVPEPFPVCSVTLAGECDYGFFHQICRFTLSG